MVLVDKVEKRKLSDFFFFFPFEGECILKDVRRNSVTGNVWNCDSLLLLL